MLTLELQAFFTCSNYRLEKFACQIMISLQDHSRDFCLKEAKTLKRGTKICGAASVAS